MGHFRLFTHPKGDFQVRRFLSPTSPLRRRFTKENDYLGTPPRLCITQFHLLPSKQTTIYNSTSGNLQPHQSTIFYVVQGFFESRGLPCGFIDSPSHTCNILSVSQPNHALLRHASSRSSRSTGKYEFLLDALDLQRSSCSKLKIQRATHELELTSSSSFQSLNSSSALQAQRPTLTPNSILQPLAASNSSPNSETPTPKLGAEHCWNCGFEAMEPERFSERDGGRRAKRRRPRRAADEDLEALASKRQALEQASPRSEVRNAFLALNKAVGRYEEATIRTSSDKLASVERDMKDIFARYKELSGSTASRGTSEFYNIEDMLERLQHWHKNYPTRSQPAASASRRKKKLDDNKKRERLMALKHVYVVMEKNCTNTDDDTGTCIVLGTNPTLKDANNRVRNHYMEFADRDDLEADFVEAFKANK
ncbi:hypothetical protein B0J14DRAFT_653917 [Halenospora varia]|nr:hypothetical protein B0J14DRAFT_653917 [Halenospora varia]